MERIHTIETAASGATQGMKNRTRNRLRHLFDESAESSWAMRSVITMLVTVIHNHEIQRIAQALCEQFIAEKAREVRKPDEAVALGAQRIVIHKAMAKLPAIGSTVNVQSMASSGVSTR
jgi:hypothetical protein